MLVVPNVGEVELVGRIMTGGVEYKLYTNDYTPVGDSVLINFTELTTGVAPNYLPVALAFIDWTIDTDIDGVTSAEADQIDFDLTGLITPVTIYGYFVTTSLNGSALLWCERFDSPPTFSDGGTLSIIPHFEGDGEWHLGAPV